MIVKRLSALMLVGMVAAFGAACDDDDDIQEPQAEVYTTVMNGATEFPANASTATGTARVEFTPTGLTYTVTVANLRNLSAAHIHAPALPGANIGVVLNFNPTAAPGVVTTGTIAAGTFEGPGTSAAAVTMDSLKAYIRTGRAYVNVHTSDAALPGNNTVGDLPGGEIRGQLVRQN